MDTILIKVIINNVIKYGRLLILLCAGVSIIYGLCYLLDIFMLKQGSLLVACKYVGVGGLALYIVRRS